MAEQLAQKDARSLADWLERSGGNAACRQKVKKASRTAALLSA
jgi:hypothetical protein